jgi:hypothetical protein
MLTHVNASFRSISFIMLMVLIASCSPPSEQYGSEDFQSAQELHLLFTNYAWSNPELFPETRNLDVNNMTDCAYSIIFHELSYAEGWTPKGCNYNGIYLASLHRMEGDNRFELSDYDLDSYTSGIAYSAIIIYSFDSPDDASRFAEEILEYTKTLHQDYFMFEEYYDNPGVFFLDRSFQKYDMAYYSKAVPNFIEFNDVMLYSHIIMLRNDSNVFVHKILSNAPRIVIRG